MDYNRKDLNRQSKIMLNLQVIDCQGQGIHPVQKLLTDELRNPIDDLALVQGFD